MAKARAVEYFVSQFIKLLVRRSFLWGTQSECKGAEILDALCNKAIEKVGPITKLLSLPFECSFAINKAHGGYRESYETEKEKVPNLLDSERLGMNVIDVTQLSFCEDYPSCWFHLKSVLPNMPRS